MTNASDNTVKQIWIMGDLRTKLLWRQCLSVLAKARRLSEQASASVTMLLLGGQDTDLADDQEIDLSACVSMELAAQEAISHGAQTVYRIEHPRLTIPRTDIYTRVVANMVQAERPWLVLMTLNDFGRESAAFCAQRCAAGLIADCDELDLQDGQVVGRCPAWGGQILADITLAPGWPTAFVTVQPHGDLPKADAVGNARIERIIPDQIDVPEGLHLLECVMEQVAEGRLEDA